MIGFSKCFGREEQHCLQTLRKEDSRQLFLLAMFASKLVNTGNQSINELSEAHGITCSKQKELDENSIQCHFLDFIASIRQSVENRKDLQVILHSMQFEARKMDGSDFRHSGLCVRSRSPICTVLPAAAPACTCRS